VNKRRTKEASGISVFLLEELGDARLRCGQLKRYLDEAVNLIEKSAQRDHFFEVAGHLIYGIPETMLRMEKALHAAAMAAAKWDYEMIKDELRPEKADQLEAALEEIRARRVTRYENGNSQESHMNVREAADRLERIATAVEETGKVDTRALKSLIAALEGKAVKVASEDGTAVADVLRGLSTNMLSGKRPSRLLLATALRRVMAETMDVGDEDRVALDAPDTDNKVGLGIGAPETGIGTDSTAAEEAKKARFETDKPADPTVNMVQEDAQEWKQNTDEHADEFKGAAPKPKNLNPFTPTKAKDLVPKVRPKQYASWKLEAEAEEKQSRHEEGKSVDPTKDMSESDANEWKQNTEEHKDNFKAATKHYAKFEEGKPADPTQDMSEEDADKWQASNEEHKDNFKAATWKA
jgi:hypothetical protein